MARKINVFWTTTYTEAGLFETLSAGRLRSHNVSAALREFGGADPSPARDHQQAWRRILAVWPAGAHHVLVAMDPARIAISPLRDGPAIAAALLRAVHERGDRIDVVTSWRSRAGNEAWRLVRITVSKAGAAALAPEP